MLVLVSRFVQSLLLLLRPAKVARVVVVVVVESVHAGAVHAAIVAVEHGEVAAL